MVWLRKRVVGLLTTLLLACAVLPAQETQQPGNKVNGLEIYLDQSGEVQAGPAIEVDGRERYVTLRAKALKWTTRDGETVEATKLEQVQWVVVTVGAVPVKTTEDLDLANASLIVGLPDDGEGLLVYACALVNLGADKRAMTRHATLSIRVVGKTKVGAGVRGPGEVQEKLIAVPAGVTGLSVVLASREPPGKELVDLAASQAVKAELARSRSSIHLYGPDKLADRKDIVAILKDDKGRDLPFGVVLVTSTGKAVAAPLLTLRYDGKSDTEILRRNELILLNTVGRAAGGK